MWHPIIWKPCGDRHRHRAPSHWVFTAIFLMFPTLRTSSSLWNYHTIVSVYHFVNYANVSHSKEPLGLAFVQPSALWVPRLVFQAHSFSLLSSILCNGYSLGSPLNGSWADSSFHLWINYYKFRSQWDTIMWSQLLVFLRQIATRQLLVLSTTECLDCRTNLHTASKSSCSILLSVVVDPSPFNTCLAVSCAFTVCWLPSSEVLHHNISLYLNVHSSISSHLDYFIFHSVVTHFLLGFCHLPTC